MNTGTQLKKAQIRQLPKAVSAHIEQLQKRYRTRNCTLYIENPGWKLYLGEGCSYTAFDERGEKMSTIRMQSERTLHAGGGWQSHQIGKQIPLPQGTWVVEFELFCGHPIVNVHHAGPFQLK